MKTKKFKPFPPGTVRGPYRHYGQTTFMVQTKTGWVPFNGKDEADVRRRADQYAKELTA